MNPWGVVTGSLIGSILGVVIGWGAFRLSKPARDRVRQRKEDDAYLRVFHMPLGLSKACFMAQHEHCKEPDCACICHFVDHGEEAKDAENKKTT